ncbi:PH domain-containing protein [Crateriforma conspicua]|nr:PH domain-containing protein [Crateriforma conspicua]
MTTTPDAVSGTNDPPPVMAAKAQADGSLRLHNATLWLPVLENLRRSLVPLAVGCLVMTPPVAIGFYALFFVAPVVLYFTIRYLTLTYQIRQDALVIHTGWLARRERRIPWDRVQEAKQEQSLFGKPLGLTHLTLKTAGSDDEEAALNVITSKQADEIRHHIVSGQSLAPENQPAASVADPAITSHSDFDQSLTTKELFLGGLTSQLIAGIFSVMGAIAYFQLSWGGPFDWLGGPMDWLEHVPAPPWVAPMEQATETLRSQVPSLGPLDVLIDLVLSETMFKSVTLAVLSMIAATIAFVIRYHAYEIRRSDDRLVVAHGLLTRQESSLSRRRIQSLKLEESPLRRWAGLASIRVDNAGDHREVDENKKRSLLVPAAERNKAIEIAEQVIGEFPIDQPGWQKVSSKAIGRGTRLGCLIYAAVLAQIASWSLILAVALSPGFALVYLCNRQWYRHTGYRISDHSVMYRKGWISRATLGLPIENIQNLRISQSPLDRRLGLATLSIDTAGQSNTGGGPVIQNLTLLTAVRLRRRLAKRIADQPFRW